MSEYRGDEKECRGFRWIGQPWSSCDNCGHPWYDHDGYWTLNRNAGPFSMTSDDDWTLVPWTACVDTPTEGP